MLDRERHLRTFRGIGLAIFSWCFPPNSTSVVYEQTLLHGTNHEHAERRSIEDDRLLGNCDCPNEDTENEIARKHAPDWVRCVPDLAVLWQARAG